MTKKHLISIGLFVASTMCAMAQTNYSAPRAFVNKHRPTNILMAMPTAAEANVVFSEDFSKFTAGSEAEPDATDISGTQAEGYVINPQYLNQPGWYGKGVHQAGGVCALRIYEYQYEGYPDVYTACGYISTPESEFFGDVEISFRAKKMNGKGTFWVGLCDNQQGPVDDVVFTLTEEWQEYTFKTDKGTFNAHNVVQFAPRDETEVLIDDIVIKRALTKTEMPQILPPINNSFEEFTARWMPTETADKYRINVYKKVDAPDCISGTIKEGFDNINVMNDGVSIDVDNPNYPEGWNINVSENGKQDMNNTEGFYASSPRSILLDEVGDIMETPETPAFVKEIRFWVRASSMEYEYDLSMFSVSVWDSKAEKWTPIANIPNYFLLEEGMVYTFNSDQIGLGVNKVRFEYIQKGTEALSFAIDDVEIDYETQMLDVAVLENYETTDTFCVVKEIDPSREHYYYVQAMQGSLVSDKTADMWVDGIVGLKPVIDAPTGITSSSFDLTWTKFYNARHYAVDLSRITTASEDMQDVLVIEENFDKITEGTLEAPGMDWGLSYDFGENGMCDTHWSACQAQWIEGMIGTRGSNEWTGLPGFISSPMISLSNNGGAFDVELTVQTLTDNDEIAVMIQKDLNENATVYETFKCEGAAGIYTGSVHFEKGGEDNCYISIMSMAGKPLYLDKIKITQNLKKGEVSIAPYKIFASEDNMFSFTQLPEGIDYGVEVTAKGMKDYTYYVSEKSDCMIVPTSGFTGLCNVESDEIKVISVPGAVRIVSKAEGLRADVYNIQGQMVETVTVNGTADIKLAEGVYIVKAGDNVAKVVVR